MWKTIAIDNKISPLIPNFKNLNKFIIERLKDYEYIKILDLSQIVIRKPDKVH